MRVVVTGAAGFIGSHACAHLLAEGNEVVGVDNLDPFYDPALKRANLNALAGLGRWRFVEADVADPRADSWLEGVDAIMHLAARPGVRSSWAGGFKSTCHTNVLGTQVLLEAAVRHRVARFLFVSSSSVYGDASAGPRAEDAPRRPGSPYGVTKAAGEDLTHLYRRECALDTVVVRPFSVYGPRERPDKALQRFLVAARDGSPVLIHGTGAQRRDFTFVGDVVEGLTRALVDAPSGATLNLGSGQPRSVLDVLHTVQEVTQRQLQVEYGPERPGDVAVTWADTRQAQALLGVLPGTPFEAGVRAQWAAIVGA